MRINFPSASSGMQEWEPLWWGRTLRKVSSFYLSNPATTGPPTGQCLKNRDFLSSHWSHILVSLNSLPSLCLKSSGHIHFSHSGYLYLYCTFIVPFSLSSPPTHPPSVFWSINAQNVIIQHIFIAVLSEKRDVEEYEEEVMEIIQGNDNGPGNSCVSVLSLILDHMIFQTGNLMVFFPFLSFRNMVLLNSPYPDVSPLLALYSSYSPWTPTRNKEMRGWF